MRRRPRVRICVATVIFLTAGPLSAGPISATVPQWTHVASAGPSARLGASISSDPATNDVVMFGGLSGGLAVLGDTWVWNGTTSTWSNPTNAGPTARHGAAMAYDPTTHDVVLFGGQGGGVSGAFLSDTWLWNGSTWAQPNPLPQVSPSARYGAAMAYDPATHDLVLFGGFDSTNGVLGDTWLWTGSTWTEVSSTGPQPRYVAGMATDTAAANVVLFGGFDSTNGVLGDTWVWNGNTSTWTNPPSSGPSKRASLFQMADVPAAGNVVLFGGQGAGGSLLTDTWIWDGTTATWTNPSNTGPSARIGAAMAGDPATGGVVLFGGTNSSIPGANSVLSDTWVWPNPPASGVLKICKIAGFGVNVGTNVTFTGVVGLPTGPAGLKVVVPAGPAPLGTCKVAGSYPVGTQISITESVPSGDQVGAITTNAAVSSLRPPAGILVTLGGGVTTVTYTDLNVHSGYVGCNNLSGRVSISPGLTTVPKAQSITYAFAVSGCVGGSVTSGTIKGAIKAPTPETKATFFGGPALQMTGTVTWNTKKTSTFTATQKLKGLDFTITGKVTGGLLAGTAISTAGGYTAVPAGSFSRPFGSGSPIKGLNVPTSSHPPHADNCPPKKAHAIMTPLGTTIAVCF